MHQVFFLLFFFPPRSWHQILTAPQRGATMRGFSPLQWAIPPDSQYHFKDISVLKALENAPSPCCQQMLIFTIAGFWFQSVSVCLSLHYSLSRPVSLNKSLFVCVCVCVWSTSRMCIWWARDLEQYHRRFSKYFSLCHPNLCMFHAVYAHKPQRHADIVYWKNNRNL